MAIVHKPCSEGRKTRDQVQKENLHATDVAGLGGYDFFVEAIRRGIYQAIMGEINRIANDAALAVKAAIKRRGAEMSLDLAKEVSIEAFEDQLKIRLSIPNIESEELKQAMLKNLT